MASAKSILVPGALWLIAVVGGFWYLEAYRYQPGVEQAAPQAFPLLDAANPNQERPALLMFLHPCCPCSRASLTELARLQEKLPQSVAITIYVLQLRPVPPGWDETELWNAALRIPGVRVVHDEEGKLARRFGATTSGQVLLYDKGGVLRFRGGITAGRGHLGDNPGSTALLRSLTEQDSPPEQLPVFGCPLFIPDQSDSNEIG